LRGRAGVSGSFSGRKICGLSHVSVVTGGGGVKFDISSPWFFGKEKEMYQILIPKIKII
jgi:hypothetical protein